MADTHRTVGGNAAADFDLVVHRGDGMVLLGMDWRGGRPPRGFVGFAITYVAPGGDPTRPRNVQNRLTFEGAPPFRGRSTSMDAPIQQFRWVHFPFEAGAAGEFTYTVTPRFMDAAGDLRSGEAQTASVDLARDTIPGKLDVTFTRGFIASQAFVDRFVFPHCAQGADEAAEIRRVTGLLLPQKAAVGLDFDGQQHPDAGAAYTWMGFQARTTVHAVLDAAIADPTCEVLVVAFDLNLPEVVSRLEQLGDRVRVIVDDSDEHRGTAHEPKAEDAAEARLLASAGAGNVKRQHLSNLQHNKTIVVTGPRQHVAVCGSTNFSWRGLYVQNNHVVRLTGEDAVRPFVEAFEQYWTGGPAAFKKAPVSGWHDLGIAGVDAKVTFTPHAEAQLVDAAIAADVRSATSSVLFSLAFLAQTKSEVRKALEDVTADPDVLAIGVADKRVEGLDIVKPDGKRRSVHPTALVGDVPPPFRTEPQIVGKGANMHHKFIVVDFDRPTARVYFGSHNISPSADKNNGENLVLVRHPGVATSFAIEALRIYDHYAFRLKQQDDPVASLVLQRPPAAGKPAWFDKFYDEAPRALDRRVFSRTG